MSHNTETVFKAVAYANRPGTLTQGTFDHLSKGQARHLRYRVENRKEGAYNPPARNPLADLAGFPPRDQSEDRKAPKFLVQGREQPGIARTRWEVIRASDRSLVSWHYDAETATRHAVNLEAGR